MTPSALRSAWRRFVSGLLHAGRLPQDEAPAGAGFVEKDEAPAGAGFVEKDEAPAGAGFVDGTGAAAVQESATAPVGAAGCGCQLGEGKAEGKSPGKNSEQQEASCCSPVSGGGSNAPILASRRTPSRPPGARQKLYVALRRGATLNAAAAQAGVDLAYAEIMCDEMKRQGLLDRAESLCASGLGACGGGTSDEVKIHCAGCPILPLKAS